MMKMFKKRYFKPAIPVIYASLFTLMACPWTAAESVVQFDLPTTVATQINPETPNQVTLMLNLSSRMDDLESPKVDQWIVTCLPRQAELRVADYSPKTETSSDVVSPITIKDVDEVNSSFGLTFDGAYASFARGSSGTDHSKKNIRSEEYSKAAPVQTISAAGTIDRGRGVYFKLRRTATHVLEGEKNFTMTLDVPNAWRGGLLDVTVKAMGSEKRFGSFTAQPFVAGSAHFVVAAYLAGDQEAQSLAWNLSKREHELRDLASQHQVRQSPLQSLPSMFRYAARRFQIESGDAMMDTRWLARLLMGEADPHLDTDIARLPMPVRLAALDYADARQNFERLQHAPHLIAKTSADQT